MHFKLLLLKFKERVLTIYISVLPFTATFLCSHFNGHFPGRPGLSNTRMSPFWILLELMMIEVVVETGAIRQ